MNKQCLIKTVSFLMNTAVKLGSSGMFISLVWMIVIPSVLGVLINQTSRGQVPKQVVPFFKPLSKLFLLCVIAINAARVSGSVTSFEPVFLLLIAVSLVLSSSGFLLGSAAGKLARLGRAETVSTMYAVGLRNIRAALVLALKFFPVRAALPVITGILFQQTLASVAGVVLIQKPNINNNIGTDNQLLI